MDEPRPLGKVKSIRVPTGKEGEYVEDVQGEPVHVAYGSDEDLPGTVIPTGKHFRLGGGSYGFSIDDLDVPQNIIACDAQGQETITQVTRRQMMKTASKGSEPLPSKEELNQRHAAPVEEIRKLADQSEAQFLAAADAATEPVTEVVPAPSRNEAPDPFEEGVDMARKSTKKPKAKKAKKSRRGVTSAEPEPAAAPAESQEQEESRHSVAVVSITGPFGKIDAHCSGIFRDGIHLVLFTDRQHLQSVFSLPPVTEPMELKVQYGDHTVTCFWAGIQFTMPSGQVTFTVLLVSEEKEADAQGLPGEARVDLV